MLEKMFLRRADALIQNSICITRTTEKVHQVVSLHRLCRIVNHFSSKFAPTLMRVKVLVVNLMWYL